MPENTQEHFRRSHHVRFTLLDARHHCSLCSGEAEFYGIVRAGSHGLGVVGLCQDLGLKVSLRINAYSGAAKSIGSRRGVGKVRRLDVRELWLQERVGRGDVALTKAPEV